jgi:glyoxylase-like metal-dependent hydrolase (beta-lactamase superfamily II)
VRVGRYTLYPVPAGRFRLDGGAMFGVVPKVLWSKAHPADEANRVEMVSRSLLIVGDGRVVLVNSGPGTAWDDKQRAIYALDPEASVTASLEALGFPPERITHVILTHLHFDHAAGSVTAAGAPAFPNAVYLVQRGHLEWARRPSARDAASFLPRAWEPLEKGGRLQTLEGPVEPFPGVFLEIVHGHTPYQQLPRIGDGTTTLLFCSDLVPFASQVRVPWVMGYDLRPVDTVREKQELLFRAAREGWQLFLEHDPRFERCGVELTDKGPAAVDPGPL